MSALAARQNKRQNNPTNSQQDVLVHTQIGEGTFGSVYRGAWRASGRSCAIKIISIEESAEELAAVHLEVRVLQETSGGCPSLVGYQGSLVVGTELWIMMEYLDGGSLGDALEDLEMTLVTTTTASVMRSMLRAVAHMHKQRKIHRDIKAKNILVGSDGEVKLSDFGVAAQLTTMASRRETFIGSPYWMAPEVIAQTKYNVKADVWSIGITAIELLTGRPPHYDKPPMKA